MLLPCPWCGPRDETEFGYGGQAHVAYPADPAALSDAEWAEYLFFRDNPAGPSAERWVHSGACRKWFNVVRDTRDYRVLAAYKPGDPRPDLSTIRPDTHLVTRTDPRPEPAGSAR